MGHYGNGGREGGVRALLAAMACAFVLTTALGALVPRTAEAMQIYVKTLSGRHITLEVEETDRIADVKEKLSEKEGVPAGECCLVFAGKDLGDEGTLREYSIQRDSTLHLVMVPVVEVTRDGQATDAASLGDTVSVTARLYGYWVGDETLPAEAQPRPLPASASLSLVGPSGERTLLAEAPVSLSGRYAVASFEVELAGDAWAASDEAQRLEVTFEGALAQSVGVAGLVVGEPVSVDPDPEPEPEPTPDPTPDPDEDPGQGDLQAGDQSGAGDRGDAAQTGQASGQDAPLAADGDPSASDEALAATDDATPSAVAPLLAAGASLALAAALRRGRHSTAD